MPLALESRRIGDVTVVTCSGRIVEGGESVALLQHLELLPHEPCIVLNLAQVDFVDSSGLGLLVRLLTRSRAAGGSVRLCAVPPRIAEVLRITRLHTLFEAYASEDDAVRAFYQRASPAPSSRGAAPGILCVGQSSDVQAYVRELLSHAGYGAMTVANVPDALTLVRALRPKVVVLGGDLGMAGGIPVAEGFTRIDGSLSIVELPADFSGHDAGDAAERLLERVRTALAGRGGPSPVPA